MLQKWTKIFTNKSSRFPAIKWVYFDETLHQNLPESAYFKPKNSKRVWIMYLKSRLKSLQTFSVVSSPEFWVVSLASINQLVNIWTKHGNSFEKFSLFWSCSKCVMNLNFMRSFDIAQGHLSSIMTFDRLTILIMTMTLISNTEIFGWGISVLEIFR